MICDRCGSEATREIVSAHGTECLCELCVGGWWAMRNNPPSELFNEPGPCSS